MNSIVWKIQLRRNRDLHDIAAAYAATYWKRAR